LKSANDYINRHPRLGWRAIEKDLDNNVDTPDNTIVYGKGGNIYAVDGYYTAQGFGGKNADGENIYRNRDALHGFYNVGDYNTRSAYRKLPKNSEEKYAIVNGKKYNPLALFTQT
jgi:hypothetical protein